MREEFEKCMAATDMPDDAGPDYDEWLFNKAWNARQPEIDALTKKRDLFLELIGTQMALAEEIDKERIALKAENERLREELSDAQRNILSRTFGNNQSA